MAGFDALYKQTVTLFNRVTKPDGEILWYPRVLTGVHLITDHSASWNSYGGQQGDNVRLHVRYTQKPNGAASVAGRTYVNRKEWKALKSFDSYITFGYGDNDDFDFFMEGKFSPLTAIKDSTYSRSGFYNYMNRNYENVFAITSVSKYNLIPHFEIMAR